MIAVVLTALITFFIASLFGYVVHRSLHQKWSGRLHQAHMTHHITLYPPEDFSSDKYRDPGKDNTVVVFGVAAVPLIALPIILGVLHILSLVLVVVSLVVMAVMSFLHGYLHDSFHIKNHWLYQVPPLKNWFARLVRRHWLHHVDMQTNFGIFVFHWDHVLRTFWSDK
jgi:sterol desaturase/sphingolipid hydroxylase (fatty acid hydroxylase superfamily)